MELSPGVAKRVQELGIEHRVIACEPEYADTAELCEHYGYTPDVIGNTILVYGRGEPKKFAACLVLATHKVDVNKTVRKMLGVKSASFASSDQTLEITGMMLGGVSAVGLPEDLPIYIDSAVMNVDEVMLGSGNRVSKLFLPPNELHKLPNMQVVEGLGIPRN